MRVLLLGGTGVLSAAVATEAVKNGHDVYIMNRGTRKSDIVPEEKTLIADIRKPESVIPALGDKHFDVIVDFLSYNLDHLTKTVKIFRGHCYQFIFISSATAYSTDLDIPITEDRELGNKNWLYASNKTLCENWLTEEREKTLLNYTIIRPYVTYGNTRIPFAVCARRQQWSVVNRILNDKPVLLWDDGNARCVLTHTSDFACGVVGLFKNEKAVGQAFHITSDETLTWNDVVFTIAKTIGKKPMIAYVSSKDIEKEFPRYGNELTGDKARNYSFDNSKIKDAVPGFHCIISFKEGITDTITHFRKTPSLLTVDIKWDACIDRVIAKYAHVDKQIIRRLRYVPDPYNKKWYDRIAYMVFRHNFTYSVYACILLHAKRIYHRITKRA